MDVIKNFERLYIDMCRMVSDVDIESEASIDQVIDNIDKLIAMLPIEFPDGAVVNVGEDTWIINLADVDLLMHMHDWKFRILNKAADNVENPAIRNKYRPKMQQQIKYCVTTFSDNPKDIWLIWLQLKYIDEVRDRLSLEPGAKNEHYTMSHADPQDFKTDAEYSVWLIEELEKLEAL
jgi:hypothetical protein